MAQTQKTDLMALIAKIVAAAARGKKGSAKSRALGADFIRAYFARVPFDDLPGAAPGDLAGQALSFLAFAGKRHAGKASVRIFNPDAKTQRCKAQAASIDTSDCKIDTSDGAAELKVNWRDPDFDAKRRAFYYVRVLERPTCRWSTWEANRMGKKVRPGLSLTIQERAWSSPIWVGA